jgi:hypothetical protein
VKQATRRTQVASRSIAAGARSLAVGSGSATRTSRPTSSARPRAPGGTAHAGGVVFAPETDLDRRIVAALDDGLRKPKYRGDPNPYKGHCYVATESLFYLMGGPRSGATPMNVQHEGDQHWYLKLKDGRVKDLTSKQFRTPVPYDKARGRGFLTNVPSKRAAEVIDRVRAGLRADGKRLGGA